MKYLAFFLVGLLLFSACSSGKKMVGGKSTEAVQLSSEYDESFDPLSLKDDDLVIEKSKQNNRQTTGPAKNGSQAKSTESPEALKEVDGYRVQIFASRSMDRATLVQQRAQAQFKPLNQKVYLIFETPFYKVRVGDFLNREQAVQLRDQLKEYGYDQALPVPSKVLVSNAQLENNF